MLAERRRLAFACEQERDTVDAPDGADQQVERLLRAEAAGEREGCALHPERGAQLDSGRRARRRRDRIRKHRDALGRNAPRDREQAQVVAGAERREPHGGRRRRGRVAARSTRSRRHRAGTTRRLRRRAAPAGALESRIAGQLEDERTPDGSARDRRPREHSRRVHDVGRARGAAIASRGNHVQCRPSAATGGSSPRGYGSGAAPRSAVTTTRTLWPRSSRNRRDFGRVACRAADVRRPDAGDDEDPHRRSAPASASVSASDSSSGSG